MKHTGEGTRPGAEGKRVDAEGELSAKRKKRSKRGITPTKPRLELRHPKITPNPTQVEYFKDIAATIREPLMVLDKSLRVLSANRSFYKFFKVKAGETVGNLIYDLGNRQWNIPALRALLETILPQKAVFNDYKVEHDFPTIGKRSLLLNARQIPGPPKEPEWILLAFVDVTEHIRVERSAEDAHQEYDARFRRLVEQLPTLIYTNAADDAGTPLYISPHIKSLLGYTPKEWLADPKLWSKTIHPADRQHVLTQAVAATQNKKPFSMEYRMVARDGHLVWVHDQFVLVNDEEGQPSFWQGIMLEITGRKQGEQAKSESEERFRSLYENATIGMYRTTPDGKILMANPALVNMLGYKSFEELSKRNLASEGYDPKYPRLDFQTRIQQDGAVRGLESAWKRKDGSIIYVRESAHVVLNDNDQPSYEGTLEDITERKQAEQELHLLSDTQRQIAQQETLADVFQLVGKKVQELIGDGYVGISWLDEQEQVMKIIGLYGFGNLYKTLVRRFKVDPTKINYPLKDLTAYELRLFRSGSLEKFEKGLYQLMMRKVPKVICAASERALKITGIYTMGFIRNDLHLGVISILAKRDITPQKSMIEAIVNQATLAVQRIKAEMSVRSSEEQLRLVTDNMQDLVVRTDLEGKILYASPSNQTVLGYEIETLLGKSIYDHMHPDDIERVREFTLASLQAQTAGKQEIRYRHADGHTLWIESTGAIIFDENETPAGAVFNSRDITERKRTETERQALLDIMEGVAATDSLNGLLELIRQSLAKVIYAENFFVVFHNKSSGMFEEVFAVDQYDPPMPPSKLEKSIVSYVFRTSEPLLLTQEKFEDLVERGEAELVGTKPAIWMGAPLKTPNETIGVMVVQNYEDADCYSERDMEFLASVGAQVAVAIERKRIEESLHDSEEKYRSLVTEISDGIFVTDETGRVTFANPALAKIHGFELANQLVGRTFQEFVAPPMLNEVNNYFKRVMGGEPSHEALTTELVRPDGTYTLVEVIASVEHDGGKIAGTHGVVRDITERRRAEIALQKAELKFRTLVEQVPAIIYTVEPGREAPVSYISPQIEQVLGFTPEEWTKQPGLWESLLHPEDRERVLAESDQSDKSGEPFKSEYRIHTKDGRVVWLYDESRNVLDERGQIMFSQGIETDITERKRAEETLQKSERRFRALVENSMEEISLIDPDGNLTWESPTARRPLGYPPNSLVGHNLFDLFHPDEREAATRLLEDILETPGGDQEAVFRFRHQDGSWRWMEGVVTNLLDEPAVQSVVINYRDVTERKQAEEGERQQRVLAEALRDTAAILNSTLDLDQVFDRILDNMGRVIEYDSADILMIDSGFARPVRRHSFGKTPKFAEIATERLNLEETPNLLEVMTTNNAHVIPNVLKYKGWKVLLPEDWIRSLVAAPIRRGSEVIGFLVACKAEADFYSEADKPRLMAFAEQVSIAVQNALLYQQAKDEISERKQAENILKEERILLRTLIDNLPDRIYVMDVQGRKLISNLADWQASGGKRMEDVIGKTDFDTYPAELAKQFWAFDKEVIDSGTAVLNREEPGLDAQGNPVVVLTSKVPLLDSQGKGVGLVGIGHDITKRKQRDEAIRSRSDELLVLYQLSRALADANELENVIALVNHHAVESVHTTFACITLIEDGELVPKAIYPVRYLGHDFILGNRQPITATPLCQRVLDQNEPVILQSDSPEIGSAERAILMLDFAQSVCLVPLWVGDPAQHLNQAIGLLILGEARGEKREPFTTERIRMARSIGDQAAVAIRRLRLHDQAGRRLQQLASMSEIDRTIASNFDLRVSLHIIIKHVIEQLRVDAADVLVFNHHSRVLEFAAGSGFRSPTVEGTRQRLDEGQAGLALRERRIVKIPDVATSGAVFANPEIMKAEKVAAYFAVPLISKGQIMGVLEICNRSPLNTDEEWLDFLSTLAGQAAIAIDNVHMFENLQRSTDELELAYDATIEGWSHALDLRDKETEGHTQRVTEITVNLARSLGLSEADLTQVRWGALLHDIGKMGVPDGILLKPGPLTDEEWVVMKKHPTFAYEMLLPIRYLNAALAIPYCHHEWWDGSGYPRGLKGEQIPLAARIFAVVDVWDALISDRPYRQAWSKEKTREHIQAEAGTHFDPEVVKIFFLDQGKEWFQWAGRSEHHET